MLIFLYYREVSKEITKRVSAGKIQTSNFKELISDEKLQNDTFGKVIPAH